MAALQAQQDPADTPDSQRVANAAGVVGSATLASRLLGYVRDLVLASFFGAGMAADAFFIAFSIPNLMRRLFAEGSLSVAFIPVFARQLSRRGLESANRLALSMLTLSAGALTAVSIMCIILAPSIVHALAYGWTDLPGKIALCVALTRIMLPYILLISLTALCMAILNVMGHFAAPALAPVLLNAAMIAAVFIGHLFATSPSTLALWLAGGVLAGGILQLAVQLPFLARHGIRVHRRFNLWHPEIKRVLTLLAPAIFGAAAYQLNSLIIRMMASMLPEGSVSYLYYADRLVQFPLGIFGIAAATAVLPALSRQVAGQQWAAAGATFNHAMRLVLFITLPSMAGLIVMRQPIVSLLFQRGAFDLSTMRLTADALLYYCIGLWAFSTVRIVLAMFYALEDIWTPVRVGMLAIASNVGLSILLMKPMQHSGLALALSLSAAINAAGLMLMLRKRLGSLGWRRLCSSDRKSVV